MNSGEGLRLLKRGGVEGWRGGGGGGGLGVPYRTEPSARNTAQYIPQHTAARQYRTVPMLNSHANRPAPSDLRPPRHGGPLQQRASGGLGGLGFRGLGLSGWRDVGFRALNLL